VRHRSDCTHRAFIDAWHLRSLSVAAAFLDHLGDGGDLCGAMTVP
jgi:hypothetical protein